VVALATFGSQLDFFFANALIVQDIAWSPYVHGSIGMGYYRRW